VTIRDTLNAVDEALFPLVEQTDGTEELISILQQKYPERQAAGDNGHMAWDYSGQALFRNNRVHEALAVHWEHYQQLLAGQHGSSRLHKGTPLVRISDCFGALGFRVHAQRYQMLTLCEDAIQESGTISPKTSGVYFRLVLGGVPAKKLQSYAADFYKLATDLPDEALFPEALLQRLDDDWLTALPSEAEALFYLRSACY
jgi:hypothetical protein